VPGDLRSVHRTLLPEDSAALVGCPTWTSEKQATNAAIQLAARLEQLERDEQRDVLVKICGRDLRVRSLLREALRTARDRGRKARSRGSQAPSTEAAVERALVPYMSRVREALASNADRIKPLIEESVTHGMAVVVASAIATWLHRASSADQIIADLEAELDPPVTDAGLIAYRAAAIAHDAGYDPLAVAFAGALMAVAACVEYETSHVSSYEHLFRPGESVLYMLNTHSTKDILPQQMIALASSMLGFSTLEICAILRGAKGAKVDAAQVRRLTKSWRSSGQEPLLSGRKSSLSG
jgi:hypothetical protein